MQTEIRVFSNEWWILLNGKRVTIKGETITLKVEIWTAKYPYEREVLKVSGIPAKTPAYYAEKARLKDDWFYDVLESENLPVQIALKAKQFNWTPGTIWG